MNLKRTALAALGATFLVGAAAPASFAAPGRPEHGPGRGAERGMMQDMMFIRLLKNADANKDGKISKDEVTAWADKMFTDADADKDGVLTPGELRKFHEARMQEWREKRRADRAERAGNDDNAETADDDAVDAPAPAEADAAGKPGRHMAAGERGPGRHHRDGPRQGMRDGMGQRGMMGGYAMMRMVDTDENGQISKAEATAAADKLFTRMDRNKDGFITVDDLPDRPL